MHRTHTRAGIRTNASVTKIAIYTTRNYAAGYKKDWELLDNVRDYYFSIMNSDARS
jgi:hypothetical protein